MDHLPVARIHIIGKNAFQNNLLSELLTSSTQLECTCSDNYCLSTERWPSSGSGIFFLIDCMDIEFPIIADQVNSNGAVKMDRHFMALFNVDGGQHLEREAIALGINGVFYKNDPPGLMKKGILAMITGEKWYSRGVMSVCMSEMKSLKDPKPKSHCLTPRQEEILMRIATGESNREMAEALNVSIHTIKTHIYNVFRKIGVNSRFQAALWAKKYL